MARALSKTKNPPVAKARPSVTRKAAKPHVEEDDLPAEPGALLREKGLYVLTGEIDSDVSRDVVTWVLEANLVRARLPHLTLIVNSVGGDASDAFAIIDIMRGSVIPVRTVGIGTIASSGLMIFMAGAKGHRILTPNTSILSHQWSWTASGKEHELLAIARECKLMSQRILEHYRQCTGLDDGVIREHLLPPQDMWLSAEEALKLSVCDAVRLA